MATIPSTKRTVPRDVDESKSAGSIPYALDSENNRIPAGGAKHSGLGHYTCFECKGQVSRRWPVNPRYKKFFSHRPTKNQPSNKNCRFFTGKENPWRNVRKTFRERLIDAKEMTVSVRFGFASSINLRTPLPLGSKSISVEYSSGISNSEITKVADWNPIKGDVSIRGQNGASEFKINTIVTTDDGDVNCRWKSSGIKAGDLFYAVTVDDTHIARVRPSAKYSRSSVFDDLTEREYLVYVSSKRESNSSLISSREPRRLTGSDGNESLWFHYFEISSSTEWPETWKIGKAVLNPDAFKVLIASPIDAKPTNPDSVIISDSRPLVLAIRTSEENQQVEAQWWSGKKEWITDELIGDGWSRKNIIPNPDFHIDRLQFMQNHTFINRPYRPIDILYQKDYVPILDEQKIIQNPAIISIVEGRKVLEEVKLLSHSKPVEISSDDFTLSSEWLLIKLAPWKVNYRFVNEKNELGREGSGIDELNDRINRIQDSEQQWQSISIDWTSQSDRLACIPALELNYTGLTDSVEVEIEDVIDIYQEKPDSRSNFSREKLPNTIQEVSDLAKLTPINFTKRYVNLREDDLTKLRQWLADLLSWEREDIDYGLRQKLQGFWIADKTEYSTISLKCNFNDGKCTRKHKVTLQNYMDRGNLAAICRGKHNFGRRGRGS